MTVRFLGGRQWQVLVSEQTDAAECRRVAKRLAEAAKFDESAVGRACIVATELATNIIRHAGSGELLAQVLDDGRGAVLELLAIDKGPGMSNVNECLRDGFSTAGTPGTGLGAIFRMSSAFDIFSVPGQGTVVLSRSMNKPAPPNSSGALQRQWEFAAICVATAGEVDCGDAWCIAHDQHSAAILVADGLGHGSLAARASADGVECFKKRPMEAPAALMQDMHRALSGGRGAAAAAALLQLPTAKVSYAGVGNISGHLLTSEHTRGMVSHNGTLGVQLLRAQQFEYDWLPDSRIVMHSDGLSGRWSVGAYPDLHSKHSAIIAGVLYRDFVRRRDDATIVVGCLR
jgi:anti-sigma regulatory factor (Ser/Thr protein kinase)